MFGGLKGKCRKCVPNEDEIRTHFQSDKNWSKELELELELEWKENGKRHSLVNGNKMNQCLLMFNSLCSMVLSAWEEG